MSSSCNITDENMYDEMFRLSTFRDFPRSIDISIIRLAKAGFYYISESCVTKCYSCGMIYREWMTCDDPMDIHRRISPSCIIVQNSVSTVSSRSNSQHAQQPLVANGRTLIGQDLPSSSENKYENKPTARESEQTQSPTQKRSNYFFFLQCVDSNSATESRKEGRDESCNRTCHGDHKNPCDSIDRPRYQNYGHLHSRISSFRGWPSYLDQTPYEMGMAGFFFAGYNDYARCFFCGGGLRNWEAGDDPWVEHARWFPNCAFDRRNKGDGFIAAVLKNLEQEQLKRSSDQNTQSSANNLSLASNINKDDGYLQTVAARSVLEMGFSNQQVLYAIQKIHRSTRDHVDVTATNIMEVILENEDRQSDEDQTIRKTTTSIEDEIESLLEENRQLREQRLCKVCLDLEATVAFLPCGHLTCCINCAPAMRKCTTCHAVIKRTVNAFLS